MADDTYIGQILLVPYTFAPRGFAFCNGQLLSIAQNTALFSLLGTTYGGNGVTTFALPNLQGRIPIHAGQGAGLSNRTIGENGGEELHTLLTSEMPAHTHTLTPAITATARCRNAQGTLSTPAGNVPAVGRNTAPAPFSSAAADANMASSAIVTSGSPTAATAGFGSPHINIAPYLTLNFVIALEGIFPSQN